MLRTKNDYGPIITVFTKRYKVCIWVILAVERHKES